MKHKVITTKQGKVVIDETAEIKEGYYLDGEDIFGPFEIGDMLIENNGKIIATINHSISLDVPMIIVEDKVDNLALEWCLINKFNPEDYVHSNRTAEYSRVKTIWANGYKSLQQKGVYSEEDLRNAIDFGDNFQHTLLTPTGKKSETDKFIQSLKQEYIELEVESLIAEYEPADCDFPDYVEVIKTNRVNGQLMAYIK